MRLLLDADIALSLVPGFSGDPGIHAYSALSLQRIARKGGPSLFLHPLSIDHLLKGHHGERALQIKEHMKGYGLLDSPLPLAVLGAGQMGFPKKGSLDHAENCFMAALKSHGVDFFVTEKKALHTKAMGLGLYERVLFLSDAVALLKDLFEKKPIARPLIEMISLGEIEDKDPIFSSAEGSCDFETHDFKAMLAKFRADGCDALLARQEGSSAISGICIVKREARFFTICFIHVAPSYPVSRYGELFLASVFFHASKNNMEQIFFSLFPGNEKFAALARAFGFEPTPRPGEENNNSENQGFCKKLLWEPDAAANLTPLEFNRSLGPLAVSFHKNRTWILPMGPLGHGTLFPDLEEQLSLFPEPRPHGNPIQRALLASFFTKKIEPGDNLMVYRTRGRSGITALGVVEDTLVPASLDEAVRYLGTRTVYSYSEINNLCHDPLIAIKFRFVRSFSVPLGLSVLKKNGVLKGVPRGVTKVNSEGILWLMKRIAEQDINNGQESSEYLIFP